MRRLKLRNLTICLCMICVVAFSVATPIVRVSALAEEVPAELLPVFDTQIYQFTDYVEESLSDPQKGILYLLLGAWVCAQGGMNEYELVDPYTTSDGVRGWLKSTGITLYNQMLAFTGGHIYDPITGTDLTPLLSGLAGYALGAATKASTYQNEADFLNDVNSSDHFYLPFNSELQLGLNAVFGLKGGLYNWQLSEKTIGDYQNVTWNTSRASDADIAEILQYVGDAGIRFNQDNPNVSCIFGTVSSITIRDFNTLFIDTDDHTVSLYHYLGIPYSGNNSLRNFGLFFNNTVYKDVGGFGTYLSSTSVNYTYDSSLTRVSDILDAYFNHVNSTTSTLYPIMSDFVKYVYAGIDWAGRYEVTLDDDLGFTPTQTEYYYQVPDDTLLDLKNLLVDIVNNTNLFQVVVDNLFKPDGTLNIDLPSIKVSINLPDTNPLPVNLNDVSEIIDNTYLDIVKQRATQASETIGEYVAFWHNCDPEVVYVSLGAILIIAIGAFIGKWGHS